MTAGNAEAYAFVAGTADAVSPVESIGRLRPSRPQNDSLQESRAIALDRESAGVSLYYVDLSLVTQGTVDKIIKERTKEAAIYHIGVMALVITIALACAVASSMAALFLHSRPALIIGTAFMIFVLLGLFHVKRLAKQHSLI